MVGVGVGQLEVGPPHPLVELDGLALDPVPLLEPAQPVRPVRRRARPSGAAAGRGWPSGPPARPRRVEVAARALVGEHRVDVAVGDHDLTSVERRLHDACRRARPCRRRTAATRCGGRAHRWPGRARSGGPRTPTRRRRARTSAGRRTPRPPSHAPAPATGSTCRTRRRPRSRRRRRRWCRGPVPPALPGGNQRTGLGFPLVEGGRSPVTGPRAPRLPPYRVLGQGPGPPSWTKTVRGLGSEDHRGQPPGGGRRLGRVGFLIWGGPGGEEPPGFDLGRVGDGSRADVREVAAARLPVVVDRHHELLGRVDGGAGVREAPRRSASRTGWARSMS